jgi:GNAT superfamily N-acetyltransferase
LAEKLALCQELYRAAGLRLLFRITPFSQPSGLDDWLAQRGYQRFEDTRVMLCPGLSATAATDRVGAGLLIEEVDVEAFAHIVGGLRETPLPQRQAHAERLRHSPVPLAASVLRSAERQVLACGQFAQEGELVGLYDVFTAPHMRGRGLSRQLCGHLLSHACARGARIAYLQVDAGNRPARAVYRRLGFADAFSYHYRALPSVGD